MQTTGVNYKQIYGQCQYEIAHKLSTTADIIKRLHRQNKLRAAIDSGDIVKRKPSTTKYTRRYGMKLPQIAQLLNCPLNTVTVLDKYGYLKEVISRVTSQED